MQLHGAEKAGASNPNAVLNSEQVSAIRSAYFVGRISQNALARRFKVGRTTISHIVKGRTWK